MYISQIKQYSRWLAKIDDIPPSCCLAGNVFSRKSTENFRKKSSEKKKLEIGSNLLALTIFRIYTLISTYALDSQCG